MIAKPSSKRGPSTGRIAGRPSELRQRLKEYEERESKGTQRLRQPKPGAGTGNEAGRHAGPHRRLR